MKMEKPGPAAPTKFAGAEGGGPYQSPNPIDAGNQWAFGSPSPKGFEAKPPRSPQVTGVNPRSTENMGKGGSNRRY